MTSKETFSAIASSVQLFPNVEQKEKFLFVIRALVSRLISLKKAAEIMKLETEVMLQLLELMGIDFGSIPLLQ